MRIMIDENYYPYSCQTSLMGQAIDISVIILHEQSPPIADFNFVPYSYCLGEYSFFNESLANPSTFYWDFGDNTTSELENPTHTYLTSGVYDVVLSVENEYGIDTYTSTIDVNIVNLEISVSGILATENQITFNSNYIGTGSYFWDFGDFNYSSQVAPIHYYSSPGEYLVSVTYESGNCTIETTYIVQIGTNGNSILELNNNLICYPNPFKDELKIKYNFESDVKYDLNITNNIGQMIKVFDTNHLIGNNEFIFQTDVNGVYFVNLIFEDKRYIYKVVKTNYFSIS